MPRRRVVKRPTGITPPPVVETDSRRSDLDRLYSREVGVIERGCRTEVRGHFERIAAWRVRVSYAPARVDPKDTR